MMEAREVPGLDSLVQYGMAVAGHEGTMCDEDGELFIKPCTQKEIDFYTSANSHHQAFADLMPTFIGNLTLNNDPRVLVSAELGSDVQKRVQELAHELKGSAPTPKKDETVWVPNGSGKIPTDRAVVLKNASHRFKKPNILDAKIGRQLWSEDAPKQKRDRFDLITKSTTHRNFGFRVAGMRVYRGSEDAAELDDEGYKIYDKDFGRTEVNDDNVVDVLRKFVYNPAAGIDQELGRYVADAFLRHLRNVQKVLEEEESRMYSSSVLFVFEGDGEALRAAISQSSRPSRETSRETGSDCEYLPGGIPGGCQMMSIGREEKEDLGRHSIRVDSGIVMDDDGDMILDPPDDDEESDFDYLPVYSVKLIDFAHAEWAPGKGPDENSLLGIRSLIKIFEELAQSTGDKASNVPEAGHQQVRAGHHDGRREEVSMASQSFDAGHQHR